MPRGRWAADALEEWMPAFVGVFGVRGIAGSVALPARSLDGVHLKFGDVFLSLWTGNAVVYSGLIYRGRSFHLVECVVCDYPGFPAPSLHLLHRSVSIPSTFLLSLSRSWRLLAMVRFLQRRFRMPSHRLRRARVRNEKRIQLVFMLLGKAGITR